MDFNPTEIISSLQAKASNLDAPLPVIVEQWLPIRNGRIRFAVCLSKYGWHWEFGSNKRTGGPPLTIGIGAEQELASSILKQYLQTVSKD